MTAGPFLSGILDDDGLGIVVLRSFLPQCLAGPPLPRRHGCLVGPEPPASGSGITLGTGQPRPSNTTEQSTLRCPAQREITSAAKGSGQRARQRRKSE